MAVGRIMRPFFPFYGSKWNLSRYYPKPEHGLVIEPFAGSAGYATFYDCKNVLLSDVDPIICGVWNYLIHTSAEDIMALPELPDVGDSVDNYDLPEEAKWLIGFWLNRGSATPKKSRTAYSARSDKGQLNWGARAKERIASQVDLIRHWRVVNSSYSDLLDMDVTWFVDPPYVEKGKYYRFGFKEYKDLAEWCLQRSGQVIVCEGKSADWLPFVSMGDFKTSLGKSEEQVYLSSK
jgi:site-specific DNA-adenine methylase